MSVGMAVLFFVLTPGILVSLPKGGSKRMVAAVHAVVFVLVFHLLQTMVWKGMEGFLGTNAGNSGNAKSSLTFGSGVNTGNASATKALSPSPSSK